MLDGVDGVVAAESVDDELVVGALRSRWTATMAGRPATVKLVPLPVIWIVSAWLVPLTMTVSAWPSPVPLPGVPDEVEVDAGDAGAGQVVDGDGVGAAEGDDVDLLDAVDVHGDVADVAGQPQPAAVGRQVDVLVDVGAVELQRVVAALALDRVAAVAGVPHERVVAGAADQARRCRDRR